MLRELISLNKRNVSNLLMVTKMRSLCNGIMRVDMSYTEYRSVLDVCELLMLEIFATVNLNRSDFS